jgi:predicted nucleic acid-binding protein
MPVVIDSSALVDLVVKTERAPAVAQAVGATDMVAPDVVNPDAHWSPPTGSCPGLPGSACR